MSKLREFVAETHKVQSAFFESLSLIAEQLSETQCPIDYYLFANQRAFPNTFKYSRSNKTMSDQDRESNSGDRTPVIDDQNTGLQPPAQIPNPIEDLNLLVNAHTALAQVNSRIEKARLNQASKEDAVPQTEKDRGQQTRPKDLIRPLKTDWQRFSEQGDARRREFFRDVNSDFANCSLSDQGDHFAPQLAPPVQHIKQEVVVVQPLPVSQKFSGRRGEEVGSFIKHFEQVATCNRWDNAARYTHLPMHLQGAAKDWFTTHYKQPPHANDWRETVLELRRAFPANTALELERRLALREQGPGEDLNSFYWSMKKLCEQVNPGMPDSEKRDRIIRAMAAPFNCLVAMRQPKSCEELEEIVGTLISLKDCYPQQLLPGPSSEARQRADMPMVGPLTVERWHVRNKQYQDARERIVGKRETTAPWVPAPEFRRPRNWKERTSPVRELWDTDLMSTPSIIHDPSLGDHEQRFTHEDARRARYLPGQARMTQRDKEFFDRRSASEESQRRDQRRGDWGATGSRGQGNQRQDNSERRVRFAYGQGGVVPVPSRSPDRPQAAGILKPGSRDDGLPTRTYDGKVICWSCNQTGHFATYCPNREPQKPKASENQSQRR